MHSEDSSVALFGLFLYNIFADIIVYSITLPYFRYSKLLIISTGWGNLQSNRSCPHREAICDEYPGRKNIKRGANCDSDHYLVQVKYRCKINCQRSKQYEKFNIDKITESDKRETFQNKIKQINDNRANKEITAEGIWVDLKAAIITEAKRTVGYQEKQDNREWFDEECRESINLKNKKYMERPTRARTEAYKEARRKADKICRKKKRAFLNEQLLQMEEDFKNNKTRNVFGRMKYMKEGFKPKTEFIRDRNVLLINNKTENMNTWKEYFEQLLNQNQNMEDNGENEEENTDEGEGEEEEIIEPPTEEEVEEVLKEQKLNKAPGGDDIPAELWKAGGQEGVITPHRIINKVWEEEKITEYWGKSIICPIFKKGYELTYSNYRGISLLPTAYKILTRI
ncbi:hypothetical protein B7P43_G14102 [Cryptotermes secundus]|uniref:Uncharacterized protein n=1 Tax=Cryptotermes secundus TaxID=105785 RepID=A0A2J7PYL4_9NEOP|nr:hypothetical protein B7P43_G14102 [Cryptotermes secundus]